MDNIIQFKSKHDKVLDFLEEVKKELEENNIDNLLIACKDNKGGTITGYCNLSIAGRQELMAHVQVDIIDKIIQQNYVTPN